MDNNNQRNWKAGDRVKYLSHEGIINATIITGKPYSYPVGEGKWIAVIDAHIDGRVGNFALDVDKLLPAQ